MTSKMYSGGDYNIARIYEEITEKRKNKNKKKMIAMLKKKEKNDEK